MKRKWEKYKIHCSLLAFFSPFEYRKKNANRIILKYLRWIIISDNENENKITMGANDMNGAKCEKIEQNELQNEWKKII